MIFNADRVCIQKFIIERLSSVTTVYDSQISQKLEIAYEAGARNTDFGVPDQVRHKPSSLATGNGKVPGISHL